MQNDTQKVLAEIETLRYELQLRRENSNNVLNPRTEGQIEQMIAEEAAINARRY